MIEREIVTNFNKGISIPARDFNKGGLDFFADTVFPMWKEEKATAQADISGEVFYKRNKPLVYPDDIEKAHLDRPVNIKGGII